MSHEKFTLSSASPVEAAKKAEVLDSVKQQSNTPETGSDGQEQDSSEQVAETQMVASNPELSPVAETAVTVKELPLILIPQQRVNKPEAAASVEKEIVPRPNLKRLSDLVFSPIASDKIRNYSDYIHTSGPSLITAALLESGFSFDEAAKLEAEAFSPKIFKSTESDSQFANYVQRKIGETYNLAQAKIREKENGVAPVAEQVSVIPATIAVEKIPVETVAVEKPVVQEAEVMPVTVENHLMVPESVSVAAENAVVIMDDHESAPEGLIDITPSESGLSEVREIASDTESKEAVGGLSVAEKLEALRQSPFEYNKYLQFVTEVHTGVRHKYDEVVQKAEKKLKRFDANYTPLKPERDTLQKLSLVRAENAKLKSVLDRVTKSLNQPDDKFNVEELNNSLSIYIERCQKLSDKISQLDADIDSAVEHGSSPIAEAYRMQVSVMKETGEQVFRKLPTEHPLRPVFERMLNDDLKSLRDFADAKNGGDVAVLEQAQNFVARRDRIKNFISYIAAEQDFQNFKDRSVRRVRTLKLSLENSLKQNGQEFLDENSKREVYESLQSDFRLMEILLNESSPEVDAGVSADGLRQLTSELKDRTQNISARINEAAVIADSLQFPRAEVEESVSVFSVEDVNAAEPTVLKEPLGIITDRARESLIAAGEKAPQAQERTSRLMSLLSGLSKRPFAKLGRALALVAAVSAPTATGQKQIDDASYKMLSSYSMSLSTNAEAAKEIKTYLMNLGDVHTEVAISDVPPKNSNYQPSPLQVPDVVPGVKMSEPGGRIEVGGWSDRATQVGGDTGIIFENNPSVESVSNYSVSVGDTYWDLMLGKTPLGELSFMKDIPEQQREPFVDAFGKMLNNNPDVLQKIGAFGKTTEDLIANEELNTTELKEAAMTFAVDNRFIF